MADAVAHLVRAPGGGVVAHRHYGEESPATESKEWGFADGEREARSQQGERMR
jgi:hypothetical protein